MSWGWLNDTEFDAPVTARMASFFHNFAAAALCYLIAGHGRRTAVTLAAQHGRAHRFANKDPVYGVRTTLRQRRIDGWPGRALRIALYLNHRSSRQLLDLLCNPPQEGDAEQLDPCAVGRENNGWEMNLHFQKSS
jgi:hypothetical protein